MSSTQILVAYLKHRNNIFYAKLIMNFSFFVNNFLVMKSYIQKIIFDLKTFKVINFLKIFLIYVIFQVANNNYFIKNKILLHFKNL